MFDNEGLKRLANAVVIRACMDYNNDKSSRLEIERFIRSEWFMILTRDCCDPDLLICKLQEVASRGKKIQYAQDFQ